MPVIKHTIYKIVNKGHKHHGEVIHHHHHDGHVAHVHKHEGEAHHKHHHHGYGDHYHKHAGSADHKHVHAGKAEHGHSHKGHFSNNHHHKGHHGHDHKHLGSFSNIHGHSGSQGGHSHGYLNHLTQGYGSLLDPNRLTYFNDDYQTALVGSHVPLYPQLQHVEGLFPPNPELSPSTYGSLSYLPDNEARYRSEAYGYATSYSENMNHPFANIKTAVPVTHLTAPLPKDFGDESKNYKAGFNLNNPMFNLFTPEETLEIENSLNSLEDIDDGKESASSEFSTSEGISELSSYDEEELEKGAFQPMKTRESFLKKRTKAKLFTPLMQYEVTENPTL